MDNFFVQKGDLGIWFNIAHLLAEKVNISKTKQNMLPSYQVSRDGAKKVFREIGLETWYVPQSQSMILAPHSH